MIKMFSSHAVHCTSQFKRLSTLNITKGLARGKVSLVYPSESSSVFFKTHIKVEKDQN